MKFDTADEWYDSPSNRQRLAKLIEEIELTLPFVGSDVRIMANEAVHEMQRFGSRQGSSEGRNRAMASLRLVIEKLAKRVTRD
jgi:hypothetical protein